MTTALATRHLGRIIHAYRTHPQHPRPLPQELVAGWLGLTQAQLSRLENGRAPERLSHLTHHSHTLGIPPHLLWFHPTEQAGPPVPTLAHEAVWSRAPGSRERSRPHLPARQRQRKVRRYGAVAAAWTAAREDPPPADEHEARRSVEWMVIMAARESADFGRAAGRGNLSPRTIEQFHDDIARLAARYPHRAVVPSFADIVELRDQVFDLLEDRQRPDETRDLYVVAGVVCGMLANASFDLGHLQAATTQARTAFLCGELAGHNGVRCWVRGMQSLIAYWRGDWAEAVSLAQAGWRFVPENGSARVRVAALEARAAGRRGDEETVRDALRRADQARSEIIGLDAPGGMLAFPEPKQSFYTASAYLGLHSHPALSSGHWAARSEDAAATAIGLFESAPLGEQRLGELALARLDLAAAQLERAELDGAAQTIRTVLATAARRPTDSVRRRLRQLALIADRPHYREVLAAAHLREEILDTCSATLTPDHGLGADVE
jgi:hypothetical protein